jgi:hypothetical protein
MWRVAAVASSLKSSPKAYRLPHPQHQQHTMERSRQGCGAFATRSVRSASFGATAYTTFDWSTQSTLQLCRPLRRARGRGQSYTAQPTTGPPSPGRSTTSKPTVSRYIDEVDRHQSKAEGEREALGNPWIGRGCALALAAASAFVGMPPRVLFWRERRACKII